MILDLEIVGHHSYDTKMNLATIYGMWTISEKHELRKPI